MDKEREGGKRRKRGRKGRGAAPPFLFSLHLSYLDKEEGRGVLLPMGVGLLLRATIGPAAPPPLGSFIYGGRGHPIDTQVDPHDRSLAVCGAPATIFHLDHIVVVLRQSPASVEHHHRHHAVVLTKLIPEALLDRSPGIVIELYVC